MKPKRKITNAQRVTLIARSAWEKLTDNYAIEEPFDTWRHRESLALVGARISQSTPAQLDELETHFLALGGDSRRAFQNATGEPGWAKRMRFKIAQLAEGLGLPKTYATDKAPRQLKGILIELEKRTREQAKIDTHS